MDIREYENSEEIPTREQYPQAWAIGATKYREAFQIAEDDQERADMYLWALVGHCLRTNEVAVYENDVLVGRRPLKWCEAFAQEREALAWRAFAKDIGDFELYSMVDGKRVERTKYRDHVWKLFKARLPERIAGTPADVLERVHIKREKKAKAKGQSYFRKGHTPAPEQPQPEQSQSEQLEQAALF